MQSSKALTLFVLLSVGAIVAACAGTLEHPERFTSVSPDLPEGGTAPAARVCADVPTTVLAPRCATAGCHAAINPAGSLDLTSPGLAARLVGVSAKTGGLLVDLAAPEQSVMYTRVQPTAPGRMPVSGDPLNDATVTCLLAWMRGLELAALPSAQDAGAEAGRTGGTVVARVAAGATADSKDHQGNVWSADKGATGGVTDVANPTIPIAGTMDSALYNGQRYGVDPATGGPGAFSYSFDVANGSYVVTLMFAELFTNINAAGGRQFDVAINGAAVLTGFDIFGVAGGRNIAVDKAFTVAVANGKIVIEFRPGLANNPKIDAILIAKK